jgi:cell division protein FtsI/penicillin-binding protein 2
VLDGIKGAVSSQDGTAFFSFNTYDGPPVAGKTGTAQTGPGKQDHSWFAGIFNPDNDPALPQWVSVAMIEHGGFGADAAAPVVRRIMDYLAGNPDPPPVNTSPAPVKKTD